MPRERVEKDSATRTFGREFSATSACRRGICATTTQGLQDGSGQSVEEELATKAFKRRFCATSSLRKAILCYGRSERPFKGHSVLREAGREAHPRICREPGRSPLRLCYGQPTVEPTPGFAANRANRH